MPEYLRLLSVNENFEQAIPVLPHQHAFFVAEEVDGDVFVAKVLG